MNIVEIRDISKRYGKETVLDGLDLQAAPGDFLVVFGLPISGKSVLVRLLTGLETPDSGQIFLRGKDATNLSPGERNIGYVPQSFALYPHFSVRQNISYPLDLARVPQNEIEEEVRAVAALLGIEDLLDRKPDQLSGGQKQRVAIARGLIKRTDVFVLDDPLVGLDFKLRERLIDDLQRTQEVLDVTFIYTTSDAVEALMLAKHIAVLDGGRIVEVGPPERLYREPKRAETMRYVGFPQANFLDAELVQNGDVPTARTPLFDVPIRLNGMQTSLAAAQQIAIGVRPEHIVLGPAPEGALATQGMVLLREDLGGEEIVYLDVQGMRLATVLRSDDRTQAQVEIDETVTVNVLPADLVVFADGERVGRGRQVN